MTPLDQPVQNAPREKLRDLQWQKLQELLRVVFDRNRFYTEKWREAGIVPDALKSLTDLPKLPFTRKSELVRARQDAMIPGGEWDSLERLHMMRDPGATVICCTPTYALRLVQVAREKKFDLRSIPVRALVHAGEPGANVPQTKARIEAAWNAKCFDHAGSSEVGAHSFECELQPNGMHIIESEFIVEVIDPQTQNEMPPGENGRARDYQSGTARFPGDSLPHRRPGAAQSEGLRLRPNVCAL